MKINFSHRYHKLLESGCTDTYCDKAILLDVFIVNLEALSKAFLEYDTDNGLFELPKKGKYMMLVFSKLGTWDLFTTLRRWTPDNELHYRSGIEKIFDIGFKTQAVESAKETNHKRRD